jgi:hypothetical protein
MGRDQVVDKLMKIVSVSLELKEIVSGDPAMEGDIDRILAISMEKWRLLDPESFMAYQKERGKGLLYF